MEFNGLNYNFPINSANCTTPSSCSSPLLEPDTSEVFHTKVEETAFLTSALYQEIIFNNPELYLQIITSQPEKWESYFDQLISNGKLSTDWITALSGIDSISSTETQTGLNSATTLEEQREENLEAKRVASRTRRQKLRDEKLQLEQKVQLLSVENQQLKEVCHDLETTLKAIKDELMLDIQSFKPFFPNIEEDIQAIALNKRRFEQLVEQNSNKKQNSKIE